MNAEAIHAARMLAGYDEVTQPGAFRYWLSVLRDALKNSGRA